MPQVTEQIEYIDLHFITTGCRGGHGLSNQIFGGVIRRLPVTQHTMKTMGCYEDGGQYSIPKAALAQIGISVETIVDSADSRDVTSVVNALHKHSSGDSQMFEIRWNVVSEAWEATEVGNGDDIKLMPKST